MDNNKLSKLGELTNEIMIKYDPELLSIGMACAMISSSIYFKWRFASAEEKEQANIYRKEFEIDCELNKPFLQKLYEMSGRGY